MLTAAAARRGPAAAVAVAAWAAPAFHSSAPALSKSTAYLVTSSPPCIFTYSICLLTSREDARGGLILSRKLNNGDAKPSVSAHHPWNFSFQYPTPRIRFAVREKRGDAKSALKNLLLNGSPCQESSAKQMRKQKGSSRSKVQRFTPGKNPYGKNKRGQNWKSYVDDDECTDTPYGTYGGKKSFTWYWPGENDGPGSNPSGFQWREESQSAKSKEKFWNESDVDEEEESGHDNLRSYRISLGLPVLGPLKLDHIKAAFRASALKWHPDKHQGPSQAEAEEKFRRCVEAYNALTCAFKSSG